MSKKVKNNYLSKLVEGGDVFDSHGYSKVKVTKDGIEEPLIVPIKSAGVHEYMEQLEGRAPRPPVIRETVKADSKEGKALGLTEDMVVQVFDNTDEDYVNALNEHNRDFTWRVIAFAIDIDWEMSDGSTAETFEQKKKILQDNGITWNQVQKIAKDVRSLTEFEEDRIDFLPVSR